MQLKLNKNQEKVLSLSDRIEKYFGEKATDFVIDNCNDNLNWPEFSIRFKAYNYFHLRLNYEKGLIGCCIIDGDYGLTIPTDQEWEDNFDYDKFFSDIQTELELRIPDKFLKANGWL